MICRVCNGVGFIEGFWLGSTKTCPACHGSGIRKELSKEMNYRILEKRISLLEEEFKTIFELTDKIIKLLHHHFDYHEHKQFIK